RRASLRRLTKVGLPGADRARALKNGSPPWAVGGTSLGFELEVLGKHEPAQLRMPVARHLAIGLDLCVGRRWFAERDYGSIAHKRIVLQLGASRRCTAPTRRPYSHVFTTRGPPVTGSVRMRVQAPERETDGPAVARSH